MQTGVAHAVDDDGIRARNLRVDRLADGVRHAQRLVKLGFDGGRPLIDERMSHSKVRTLEGLHFGQIAYALRDDRGDELDPGMHYSVLGAGGSEISSMGTKGSDRP